MREIFFLRIQVVEYNVSIGGTTGSKDDDFCKSAQSLEKLLAMRAHSDACLHKNKNTETVLPPSTGKSNLTV